MTGLINSENQIKKTGIIGGTFNPVHLGHLILAENAYDALKLDKVWFMPTGKSYLKDQSKILPAAARIELLEAATEDNEHFFVSDFETKKSGNTYTYETLKQLNAIDRNEVLYFIIGEDSIYNIEMWREPQAIFDNCVLVVAPRDHEPDEKLISIKSHLEDKYGASIELLDAPDIDISSSMIRDRIQRGASIKYYIPDKVAEIIYSRGYYRQTCSQDK